MIKSVIIFLVGASLSSYLYITYGQETSLSTDGLLGTLALIFISIPMTITGFVLFIRNIDHIVANRKVENNFLSKSYLYLKVAVGFLFVSLGFHLMYNFIADPPYDKGSWIWIILFLYFFFRLGSIFILEAYRKLKDK